MKTNEIIHKIITISVILVLISAVILFISTPRDILNGSSDIKIDFTMWQVWVFLIISGLSLAAMFVSIVTMVFFYKEEIEKEETIKGYYK
jgi:hypothetical protein